MESPTRSGSIEAGIYRAGDPLAPSTAATTVRVRDGQRLTTDGPFAETKEVLGGYYIVDCPTSTPPSRPPRAAPVPLYGSVEVAPVVDMRCRTSPAPGPRG